MGFAWQKGWLHLDLEAFENVAHLRWLVSDNADEHLEQLRPYVELGFNHLVFHSPGDDQARFLDLYGSQILPRIRAQWG